MDKHRALAILDALAAGVDPDTGEVLPPASVAQRPAVIHALLVAADGLRTPAPVQRRAQPGKAGLPWSEQEDRELAAAFDAGSSQKDLAARHQRSLTAIRARLVRLGRLEDTVAARFRISPAPASPG